MRESDVIKNLCAIRQQRGLTQEAVAYNAGISVSHLSKVERSVASPTVKTLIKLADALEVDVREMFRTRS